MLFPNAKPYVFASVAVAAATVLRLALVPALGWEAIPFATYFIAVIATASFRGMRAGITAAILSVVAAGFLFVRYPFHVFPAGKSSFVSLPEFALSVAFVLYMIRAKQRTAEQVERALEASAEQLRRFVNAVPTGIIRCSRNLQFLSANPAYAAIAGLPVERIVGRPIVEVIGADAWETIRPKVERALRGERLAYETDVPFSTGGRRYLHVVYTPETNEHGEVVGWIASITDMTATREAKEQLARVEKLAAAGQLAASLAHEINNPLHAVMNCLYLLEAGSADDQTTRTLINSASKELARLGRIVNQSLSYYRVGAVEQKFDLVRLVRDSLLIFAEKFERAGVKVREKIICTPTIPGFPDEIRQVIDNLLLNAVESMPKGGELTVAVRPSTLWASGCAGVRLTVADTGSGMGKSVRDRIFEPFFTTKAEKGTGLGLWVVKGILAKHGATIQVRSCTRSGQSGTVISTVCPAIQHQHASRAVSPSAEFGVKLPK